MDTRLDEIADGIYRLSTHLTGVLPEHGGLTVNQFLVLADEPLLFHTGLRSMFPAVVATLARVLPVPRLRWLSFGHLEADECGAMNHVLAVAPAAEVAFGRRGCRVSLDDMADRPPRPLAPGEAIDLGGRRVVAVATPHAPHNMEAQVLVEETTRTVLCGDLFTQLGPRSPLASGDLVTAAIEAEAELRTAPPGPAVPAALRRLADFAPRTLATMHGSAYEGDAVTALTDLADAWELRFGGPSPTRRPDNPQDKETRR
ncbi:MAG TPA: MBL fold metallo-hydrolase [Acidimicrobiales bacterium]|nr:MBL fold metallo-hydrolase [Acidimicrobiales bacterium]